MSSLFKGLGATMLLVGFSSFALGQYVGTRLQPGPYGGTVAVSGAGQSGGTEIAGYGYGDPLDDGYRALVWSDKDAAPVSLHPDGYANSIAVANYGGFQTGYVQGEPSGGNPQAAMWQGTAASFVNLNPFDAFTSYVAGMDLSSQVGSASGGFSGFSTHAVLWNGSAASAVDLNPSGAAFSYAQGVWGNTQVGAVAMPSTPAVEAAAWQGTAASFVSLHPAGFIESTALSVNGSQIAGWARTDTNTSAMLWTGLNQTPVNLNPAGFFHSEALFTSGGLQVGATIFDSNSSHHAALWSDSAASHIDLHNLIDPILGIQASWAAGIDNNGVIVGYGFTASQEVLALAWTPDAVPEPASVLAIGLGLTALAAKRRKK